MTFLLIEVIHGILCLLNDQFRCNIFAIAASGDKNMPNHELAK